MDQPRIGVYICWCGSNIAKMVDVESVAQEMDKQPNVVISKTYKYMCSDPGQEILISDIKKHKLNRIVIAACSPRIHELTFRKALENSGLNPYLLQMANIREQDSWVHIDEREATAKAKSLIRGAIYRVNYHEALEKRFVEINPATLVIGGGISGLTAALDIAYAGKPVFLVEQSDSLGGYAAQLDLSYPGFGNVRTLVDEKIREVKNQKKIKVLTNTKLKEIYGFVGNFGTRITTKGKEEELRFGNIIVATGLKPFDPSVIEEYKYKKLPDVITSFEFEKRLLNGDFKTSNGIEPENVAIIHCVGSRNNKYHEYCSRTCCMTALKYANQIRSALPESNIFELYADMRAFGKNCEELYALSSKRNILFLMYDQKDELPTIRKNEKSSGPALFIELKEKLSGEEIQVPADLVILMTAMEAREDAKETARMTGISLCGNEFFIEKHPKLDPVATTTDGIYIVGSCQGPKSIAESITQSKAAVARVLSSIAKGTAEVEVTTASVNEEICCGCQTCISVCPYSAIHFDEEKKVSVVNEVLCKGCGTCGSTCPTGAIRSKHFTDLQILSQIEGLLEMESEELSTE